MASCLAWKATPFCCAPIYCDITDKTPLETTEKMRKNMPLYVLTVPTAATALSETLDKMSVSAIPESMNKNVSMKIGMARRSNTFRSILNRFIVKRPFACFKFTAFPRDKVTFLIAIFHVAITAELMRGPQKVENRFFIVTINRYGIGPIF